MNRTEFNERLAADKPLLLDGAMGTALYSFGVALDKPLDLLNLENPKLVADVHRAYVEAGADVILTNSFGANRFKLGKHGVAEKVTEINSAAVTIARRVVDSAFRPILVAGSVGPLAVTMAPLGRVTPRQVKAAFTEQITALVEPLNGPGIDLLVLETMSNLHEVRTAVEVARTIAPHLPIIAQMTFNRDDRTLLGNTAAEVALQLERLGVEAIGINCSTGPAQILRLLNTVRRVVPNLPLAASPNAGWPEDIEGGRVLYPATPNYFADYVPAFAELGVRVLGGCCGTTADHIAAMRREIDAPTRSGRPLPRIESISHEDSAPLSPDQPTRLAQALAAGQFVRSAEMTPPHGIATQRLIASGRSLHEAGASFLNVADMPQARMRMSAWAAAHLIQQEVGVETVLHFPTRGRSLLRIQADLLGVHALGLRNLFISLGDRAKVGDYPEADNHYDILPAGLIKLIKQQLNKGLDNLGKPLDQPTNFVVGCGVNLTPSNPTREMRLLHENIEGGADFALSRFVFDVAAAQQFLETYRQEYGDTVPIIAAVQPLYNASTTEFLHNEVPGVSIPKQYREAMRLLGDDPWQGVNIAQEIALGLRDLVQGVVVVPYGDRYDLAAEVLDVLGS